MLNTVNVTHMNTTLYNQKLFRHKSDNLDFIQRVKLHANGHDMWHSILQIVQGGCIFDLKKHFNLEIVLIYQLIYSILQLYVILIKVLLLSSLIYLIFNFMDIYCK